MRGRWSLIDRFDADGRRFIVAYRNEAVDPRGLSGRELDVMRFVALGQANKVIASNLGIAEGTVATVIARGMRKLRARSRAELVTRLTPPPREADVWSYRPDLVVISTRAPSGADTSALTPSETAVARAATRGLSNREIAEERRCSPLTVAHHLSAAYRKLHVASRAELARVMETTMETT